MYDPTLPADAPQKLALQTRKGGTIENLMNPTEQYAGVDLQIRDLKSEHPRAVHRNVGPSARYNCHGLIFAARRTQIDNPKQVQRILNEDGYRELEISEPPSCGDIAIYREDGDIVHSGLVVDVKGHVPWILGKWGECHEVIHHVRDCPYKSAAVKYYRLMK
jgi:hypothetical protein